VAYFFLVRAMSRSLILTAVIGFVPSLVTPVTADSHGKCIAIYAPKAEYPSLTNGQRPEGEGLFVCHVDSRTGLVTSVSVAKSTGSAILNKAAVDSLRRWKFQPGTCARDVKIPLGFWHHVPQT